jgi:hypothetical protein
VKRKDEQYTEGELVDLERTARDMDKYHEGYKRAADALRRFCDEQRARNGAPVMAPVAAKKAARRAGKGAIA